MGQLSRKSVRSNREHRTGRDSRSVNPAAGRPDGARNRRQPEPQPDGPLGRGPQRVPAPATSGACATSRLRPACRAAPSTGSSTRWSARTCCRRRPAAGSASARCSTRTALILADRLDVTRVARPVLDRVTASTGETAILCLYAPEPAPVLGGRRGRVRRIPSATSGSRCATGTTSTSAPAARASSRSCRPTSRATS